MIYAHEMPSVFVHYCRLQHILHKTGIQEYKRYTRIVVMFVLAVFLDRD